MADELGLIRNRRYIVWDAEKASLNKLLLLLHRHCTKWGLLFADRDRDDDVDIFDDLDNAESVGGDTGSCQKTIRPGPIKLRKQGRRRLFYQRQVEVEKHEEAEDKEACSDLVTCLLFVFGLFNNALSNLIPLDPEC
jgi:hypothetical protein